MDFHYVLTMQAEWGHGTPGQQVTSVGTARGVYTATRTQARGDVFRVLYDQLLTEFPAGYGNPVVLFWSLEPEKLPR